MMRKYNLLLSTTVALMFSSASYAERLGLSELYQLAITKDPDFAAARAEHEAGQSNREIGLSNLLPSINAGVEYGRTDFEQQTLTTRGTSEYDFTSKIYTLRLSQPVFNMARFSAWREGNARADYSDALFADARQALMLDVAGGYFNYLLALDNIELAKAQKEAYRERMNQTDKLFASGAATITDAEESKAYYQISQSEELAAINTLEQRRRELQKLIGELPTNLRHVAENMPLALPEPNSLDIWLNAAETQNLKVISAQINLKVAQTQTDKAQAEHYPTINLTASHQKGDHPNYFTEDDKTSRIGVVLDIPLYQGGRISASTKQSAALRDKAAHEVEAAVAEARTRTTEAFFGVLNGVAKIQALEQAVKSNQKTVDGMIVGQKVGIRTNTDLLNAQQQLYQTRRDLLKERYLYLLSRLQLKAATGTLSSEDLLGIDHLLAASEN
jgi:TolC family type I secretion outer membrane protein